MNKEFFISRDELAKVFGNPRVVRQFEQMQQTLAEVESTTGANVADTGALKDASFVTLSRNAELPNEYVLRVAEGLSLTADDGAVEIGFQGVIVTGGFTVRAVAMGDSEIVLPLTGVIATRDARETLRNKTLESPLFDGLVSAADDAAAAAAGVPLKGAYLNGGALRVRLV